MCTGRHLPALSLLTLCITASFSYAAEINTAFLQGITDIPSILKDGVRYPAGQYYVDVLLNGVRTGRMALTVTPDEERRGILCLSPDWLKEAGIVFRAEAYAESLNTVRGCYELARKESTGVSLDLSTLTMDITIPQAWLPEKNDAARWDYGVNGLRVTYNGNFNKNLQSSNSDGYGTDNSLGAWGSLNTTLNMGRWVLSGNMNATRNAWGSQVSSSDLTLSTAVSQIKGDLMLGRSQTRTNLFNDFSFYGAAVRSNSNMRSWQTRGYAPVISGVATTTSRITITQGGYTVYSAVVPPGPYSLNDVTATGNGSLIVTVEDNGGHKTVTEYPVATLPTLLRPGDYTYNVAVGQRTDSSRIEDAFSSGTGTFSLASLDLGMRYATLNVASLLHSDYQAAGLGATVPLGGWGALSANVNASRAQYDDGSARQGMSTTLKYAKSFASNTDIQLLTYRYQSPGYTEFANWDPTQQYRRKIYIPGADGQNTPSDYIWFNGREKARYEARVSQRVGGSNLSASFWQQSYWNKNDAHGAMLSAGTTVFDDISLFMNGTWSRNAWSTKEDWSASVGLSIPFTLGGIRHYSSNTAGYTPYGGASFNTSASASVNERLNYSVNAGTDAKSNNTAGASVSYAFDRIQTNAALSQSSNTTTVSGSLSGSAIATAQTGLLLTRESTDTVAVLNVPDTPGVTFGGSSLPTNSGGSTVMYLSAYNPTTISINPENVPENTELLHTSYEVVPTERAIIYREFDYQKVLRYIVRVQDVKGGALTGGSATTEQGLDAGFIAGNGVLLMNLLAAPKTITVRRSDGSECHFDASGLKAGAGIVQETRCE